jgi:uncharacterized membrane protein YoaK (UPF0700 family)
MTLRSFATATLPAANRFAVLTATSGVIWALVSLVMPLIAHAVRRINRRSSSAWCTGNTRTFTLDLVQIFVGSLPRQATGRTIGRALDASAGIPRGSDGDRLGSSPRWCS